PIVQAEEHAARLGTVRTADEDDAGAYIAGGAGRVARVAITGLPHAITGPGPFLVGEGGETAAAQLVAQSSAVVGGAVRSGLAVRRRLAVPTTGIPALPGSGVQGWTGPRGLRARSSACVVA